MLKDLLTHPAMVVVYLILICAALVTVTGCKTLTPAQQTTAHLGVVYATSKYIEQAGPAPDQQARAARVIQVVDELDALSQGATATVDELAAFARSKLPASLSPADRVLANSLITIASDELKARIGEGVGQIPPDAKLNVAMVLSWVREGAESFAQPAH